MLLGVLFERLQRLLFFGGSCYGGCYSGGHGGHHGCGLFAKLFSCFKHSGGYGGGYGYGCYGGGYGCYGGTYGGFASYDAPYDPPIFGYALQYNYGSMDPNQAPSSMTSPTPTPSEAVPPVPPNPVPPAPATIGSECRPRQPRRPLRHPGAGQRRPADPQAQRLRRAREASTPLAAGAFLEESSAR